MYRRPRSLEILLRIREEMAREADFDVDLFVERIRSGEISTDVGRYSLDETVRPKVSGRAKAETSKKNAK